MRYLSRHKNGNWYFRYQIPLRFRHLFGDKSEVKRSLGQVDKKTAYLYCLKYQLAVKERMAHINTGNVTIEFDPYVVDSFIDTTARLGRDRINESLSALANDERLVKALKLNQLSNSLDDEASQSRFSVDTEKNKSTALGRLLRRVYPDDSRSDEMAEKVFNEMGFSPLAKESPEYDVYREGIRVVFQQLVNARKAIENLDFDHARSIASMLEESALAEDKALQANNDLKETPLSGAQGKPNVSVDSDKLEEIKALIIERDAKPIVDGQLVLGDFIEVKKSQRCSRLEGKKAKNSDFKEVNAYSHAFKVVHEIMGKTDINDIDIMDVERAKSDLRSYPCLPSSAVKKGKFDGMTAAEIIKHNENEWQYKKISEKTVGRYLQRVSTIYKWAMKYRGVQSNPFEGVGDRRTTDDVENVNPFNEKDLLEIFSFKSFKELSLGQNPQTKKKLYYQYWFCLIAIATGARPTEIAQLQISDIREENGIKYVDINDEEETKRLKNETAKRRVPIHSKLFELGFDSFVEGRVSSEFLFDELEETESTSRYDTVYSWFSYNFTDKMKLKEQNKSFYSFRHWLVDAFKQKGVADHVCGALVGHIDNNITYGNYGSKMNLPFLKEQIDQVDLDDVLKYVKPFEW
ncbi:tyrosine-type recombinase/integrase [Vibrio cyclitrophicus]|uniref:Tyr recombinase domain-containing protein n=2 Tax=Vibrio cyclitrophicus TaxID=47951 RepID=A0A7Z1S2W1_9VIBR|nr:site-specific integrase [Vibrio cyclitrophicus]PMP20438.1 hypothetical protein BCS91_21800 [Vibrio cyclitrophicus]PMP32100.1 hypothetical protein BCS90_10105 [Vibrio cyclitrophicus]